MSKKKIELHLSVADDQLVLRDTFEITPPISEDFIGYVDKELN